MSLNRTLLLSVEILKLSNKGLTAAFASVPNSKTYNSTIKCNSLKGIGLNDKKYTTAATTLSKDQINDLVFRLNDNDRDILMNTLKQYESNKVKSQLEG